MDDVEEDAAMRALGFVPVVVASKRIGWAPASTVLAPLPPGVIVAGRSVQIVDADARVAPSVVSTSVRC